jgi:hypothetical protein
MRRRSRCRRRLHTFVSSMPMVMFGTKLRVHHVDVDQIDAGTLHRCDIAAERREICRQNGWRNLHDLPLGVRRSGFALAHGRHSPPDDTHRIARRGRIECLDFIDAPCCPISSRVPATSDATRPPGTAAGDRSAPVTCGPGSDRSVCAEIRSVCTRGRTSSPVFLASRGCRHARIGHAF